MIDVCYLIASSIRLLICFLLHSDILLSRMHTDTTNYNFVQLELYTYCRSKTTLQYRLIQQLNNMHSAFMQQ